MPEAEVVTEITQPKPGAETEVKPEVKTDQTQDGVKDGAASSTELPATGEQTTETATVETGEKPDVETEGAKPKEGIEKRFSELTRREKEALRQRDEAEERARQATEALIRLGKQDQPKKEVKVDEDPEPQQPEFSDPETFTKDMAAYTRQLTTWAARQAVKADRVESEKRRTQETQVQFETRVKQEHSERVKKARETFTDYEEVAEDTSLPITQVMGFAIMKSEEGPAVNYYLGQHRDEAARIAKLPPDEQLIEFGIIKERLLAARKAPVNKLPSPIRPTTGSTGTTKTLDDLDMESYAAKRNEDLRGAARH